MRTAGSILGIALAAALAACAQHNAQTAGAQTSGQAQANVASCPLAQIRGVHATVADIRNGVAITFTGPESELDQLRDNVKTMADANDKQGDAFAACPCAEGAGAIGAAEAMPSDQGGGQTATTPRGSVAATGVPLADAKVEDIPTGAVLKLTAKDNSQVSALRSSVRQNVHMLKKACLEKGAKHQSEPGGQDQENR